MAIFDYEMLLISVVLALGLALGVLVAGAVLLVPDEHGDTIDLWRFRLANRRRYLIAVVVCTVLGSWLGMTFLPADQFLTAVCTVGLPMVAFCIAAMVTSALWAQRAIALAMVALLAWYFWTCLPGFSG